MQEAAQALGGLDGLVNAAGVFINKDLMETERRRLEHHDRGEPDRHVPVRADRRAVPASGRRATIVNLASGVGLLPTGGGSTAYVASKGGVIAMTRALAAELAPGIRVNAVCPGAVETPMTDGTLRDAAGAINPAIVNRYALGRPAVAGGDRRRHPVPDRA